MKINLQRVSNRGSPSEVFCNKNILKNFVNLSVKHLLWRLFGGSCRLQENSPQVNVQGRRIFLKMMLIEFINIVSFSNDNGKSCGELIDKFYL